MSLSLLYAINSSFEELAAVSLASFLIQNRFNRVYCITPSYVPARLKSLCLQLDTELLVLHIPSSHPISQLPDPIRPYFYCVTAFDLLGEVSDNILYVDADTLCVDSVEELSSMVFGDKALLAACSHGRPMIDRQLALGLQSPFHYFNAGVLLFNPSKISDASITSSLVSYYMKNTPLCRFREQCALNEYFSGYVAYLPSSYNYLSWMRPRLSDHVWQNPLHNPFSANLESIRSNLSIVHLSARALPLNIPVTLHEPVDRYWYYLYESLSRDMPVTSIASFIDYSSNPSNF